MICDARQCVAAAAGLLALSASAQATDPPIGGTQVGATLFLDASRIDRSTDGAPARREDGADLKRFYLDLRHRFGDVWSMRVTTDVNWLRDEDPSDVWVKHAYLEGRFSRAFALRLGSAPLPWAGFANHWYGYRYVDKELVTRNRFGGSADWGAHALGTVAAGHLQYAVSAVTGAGYKKPRTGDGVDVEARLAWQPGAHTVLGLGGYRGRLAEDTGPQPARHVARRWDLLAAYADARWRLGVQYFRAEDWKQVSVPRGDAAHGWSAWASVQLAPAWSLFVRHDRVRPDAWLDPLRHERYSNLGVEWHPRRWLRLAAVCKRERLRADGRELQSVDEAGLWAQLAF